MEDESWLKKKVQKYIKRWDTMLMSPPDTDYSDNPGACLRFPNCDAFCPNCKIDMFNEYEEKHYPEGRKSDGDKNRYHGLGDPKIP